MVVIDATTLLVLLRPGTLVPTDASGVPIEKAKERIEYLVKELEKSRTKIIIPTPALSEILVRAGAAASEQIVDQIQRSSVFRIEPFDTRAAIEVAAMSRDGRTGKARRVPSEQTYAKLKYDRQIVGIAKVNGATEIYSEDKTLRTVAGRVGIKVIKLSELPLPPEDKQLAMNLGGADPGNDRPIGEPVGQEEAPR